MIVEPITKPRKPASDPTNGATLWEAFAAAQAEFGPIIKNTKGARGNYAPLDAVLEAVRPVLNKHGLALTQATFVADGTLFVRCSVVHVATGEAHHAEYPAGGFALQHQQLGAGVTYARRYSLLSILGVFPENEDDNGEKAGTAGGERPPAQTPPRQQTTSIRQGARPFIEKASAELQAAAGDFDAVTIAFDAIKARPGWQQLNDAERAAVNAEKAKALPDVP